MSKSADKAFVKAFDDEVKHAYQGGGLLRETVSVRNNIGAESYQFQKLGSVTMSDHASQSKFEPADIEHTNAVATLTDKRVSELTDLFDDDKMDINERQELSMSFGQAMGRQEDQVIYDTIDNGSYSGDRLVEETIGGNNAFNTTKIRAAKEHFDSIEAPESDRYFVVTPKAMQQLLGTTAPTSSDFNTVRALVDGDLDSWMGFDFKVLPPERKEGGITVSSDIANNYAYHKTSVGCAIGTGPRTDVDWEPIYASWLTQGFLSIGAALRDTEGQVQVQTDQSVDVTQGTEA